MNFNDTILAIEMENLQQRENEMYKLYSELLNNLKNKDIKEKIKFIKNQELEHIAMVTSMISILREHIIRG